MKERVYGGGCTAYLQLYFTTKPKGSGIGLAMTYRFCRCMAGRWMWRSNADRLAADHGTTSRCAFRSQLERVRCAVKALWLAQVVTDREHV